MSLFFLCSVATQFRGNLPRFPLPSHQIYSLLPLNNNLAIFACVTPCLSGLFTVFSFFLLKTILFLYCPLSSCLCQMSPIFNCLSCKNKLPNDIYNFFSFFLGSVTKIYNIVLWFSMKFYFFLKGKKKWEKFFGKTKIYLKKNFISYISFLKTYKNS